MMSDPSEGPIAAASAPTAPQRATALARRATGKACSTTASEEGSRSAAPTACSARAAISAPAEGARPQSAEAALKSARPTRKVRFRPTRSAMRPAGTRRAPNTIVYALRTQESWAAETCANVARMAGKATKRTVPSRETTNTATLVSASVRQAEEEGVIVTPRVAAGNGCASQAACARGERKPSDLRVADGGRA